MPMLSVLCEERAGVDLIGAGDDFPALSSLLSWACWNLPGTLSAHAKSRRVSPLPFWECSTWNTSQFAQVFRMEHFRALATSTLRARGFVARCGVRLAKGRRLV